MSKNIYIILFILFFIVLGILAFKKDATKNPFSKENSTDKVVSEEKDSMVKEEKKLEVKKEEPKKIMNDSDITKLEIKVIKEGVGDLTTKNGNILSMNYTGRLLSGKVFDSNIDSAFGHQEPFVFQIGAGQVIRGWDEGLLGMKKGEKRMLTIPSDMAYGSRGAGSSIPPNAALIFEVELLDFK